MDHRAVIRSVFSQALRERHVATQRCSSLAEQYIDGWIKVCANFAHACLSTKEFDEGMRDPTQNFALTVEIASNLIDLLQIHDEQRLMQVIRQRLAEVPASFPWPVNVYRLRASSYSWQPDAPHFIITVPNEAV